MRSSVVLSVIAMSAELLSAGCSTGRAPAARPAVTPAIEQVAVEPKTLDLKKQSEAGLRYSLPGPATVSIELYNEDGQLVRQLALGRQEAGAQTARWDGRDGEGNPVLSGVYRYVIRAHGQNGQEWVYDPSQEMGGEEIEPRDFQWNPQNGQFRWVMPKAGHARLRIGMEGFPHLRTLLDWEPMEAGEQILPWDGLDSSGLIQLKEHPQLSIKLAAFALAPNTLILRGGSPEAQATASPADLQRSKIRPSAMHASHPRRDCRDVPAELEFPKSRSDSTGRPLLKGVVPVRVRLSEEDAGRFANERFELAIFVDLTVIFESEDAVTPFTFLWDTSHLSPGQHLLTVNVLGIEDHFGVKTRAVMIGEPS